MATYAVPEDKLTAIADAIRLKRDLTTDMTLDDMALQIGLIDGGGGDVKVEQGTFTLDAEVQNYIIPHSLSELPNFVLVYPIDVTMTAKYDIIAEMIVWDLGQTLWSQGNTGNNTFSNNPFVLWIGNGYATNAYAPTAINDSMKNLPDRAVHVSRSDTEVRVGAANQTTSAGKLVAGTYGYIIAKF